MKYDRFLIAPINTGMQTNLRPWLIPDDAFQKLDNAYVFRGRVRKRFGSRLTGFGSSSPLTAPLYSRFRINLGNTDGAGAASGSVPSGAVTGKIGQMFSIGDEIYTVYQLGTPAAMKTTGTGISQTYNTTSGAYAFTGADISTPIWFYPGLPVMGLTQYEVGPINNQPTYGFDTRFSYVFAGGFWQRSVDPMATTTPEWHGTDINFFWTENWRGDTPDDKILFVTNFYVVNYNGAGSTNDDPIWSFDGANWVPHDGDVTAQNGFFFLPGGNAPYTGPYVKTARLVIAFKNRLLLLNTVENDNPNHDGTLGTNTNYVNRCRYSFNGSPFAQNAWYEPNQIDNSGTDDGIAAGAGFIDATTEEAIISAEFIKDRLIVYFERSTWELAYTGNALLPFVWQKINTELGSEAQQSTVPFDKQILTIGNTGVHACNGANVERIDQLIPDEVFEIFNKDIGVQRVAGIRDYFTEMVYWCFPSIMQNQSEKFPARVLVYNYRNPSWSINDDCITSFGYLEQQPALTWASWLTTWEESNFTWNSGSNATQFRQVIAGNQQGYVFILDPQVERNAPVMQITEMTYNATRNTLTLTILDHTLNGDLNPDDSNSDFVYIENAQGVTFVGSTITKVVAILNTDQVEVLLAPGTTFTGTYTGGGTAARVSNIRILSKQWNPYVQQGTNLYLAKIDFGVERTTAGQITVDYYPNDSEFSMIQGGQATGAIMGNNVLETSPYPAALYPFEQVQDRLWHPIYFQTEGECIQIFMYMVDNQMFNVSIALSPFQLEGMVLHTMQVSTRLQ